MAKKSDKGTQPAKAAVKPEKGSSKAVASCGSQPFVRPFLVVSVQQQGTPVREM